jgi:anti-sigma factor RsiW
MCDLSGRLIAWLDRELREDEAADVERHLRACAECRSQVAAFEQVSGTFDAYCDAVIASNVRRRLPRWVPVWSGAAAAVAAALLLAFPRAPVEPFVRHPAVIAVPPAIFRETAPPPTKTVRRRHATPRVQSQNANVLPAAGPAIQIAIPAEGMFPPGAVPDGISFTADLSIAADGSAQRLRLQPRLVGFERRATQP